MANTLTLAKKGSPVPFVSCTLAEYINSNSISSIAIEWINTASLSQDKSKISSILSLNSSSSQNEDDIIKNLLVILKDHISQENSKWVDLALSLNQGNFSSFSSNLDIIEAHLFIRSFISGYSHSISDYSLWAALRASAIFQKNLKSNSLQNKPNLLRWYSYISSLAIPKSVLSSYDSATTTEKAKDQGSFELGLKNLVDGEVCTRFPPEPSGYLHIGHAKAALLNQHIAKSYNGRLIVRFDDTNPSKEKTEFEETIFEDLKLIGIAPDLVTHTSDYFDRLQEFAHKLIINGDAYVDDTEQAVMREQRMVGEPSSRRDLPVDENLRVFGEIVMGSEEGQKYCLRAKISVDDKNKAMRDPVIYRVNLTPHHRTGTIYRAYPLYDFACPIVDSIEGVTHALRSNEYRDRNPLYYWFTEKLSLRQPQICDFSRLNFVYTLLSKRKLQWFVDNGLVSGWDDPRFPTVRGIRRRGLTIEALRQYILMQGASQNQTMLEWDKLWSINKKIINPTAPRFTAIESKDAVLVTLIGEGVPATAELRTLPLNKQNLEIGNKQVLYSSQIYLEQADASSFEPSEEITLMDFGNAFVDVINRTPDNIVTSMTLRLNLSGNVKTTKKKVTWLSAENFKSDSNAVLMDYDYLINKRKLEDTDEIADNLTKVTEFQIDALVDPTLLNSDVGTIIQLERKGFYIVDKLASQNSDNRVRLILIPDGKAANLASKSDNASSKPDASKSSEKKKKSSKNSASSSDNTDSSNMGIIASKVSSMYSVEQIVKDPVFDVKKMSSMYTSDKYV
ncbi:putative glutamate-tRNA ligase, cytoplasmic [Smittium culicis]|uniref:Probable glutamate--tRNA ligase, cytoplasmic n=1 Tax=Smittium culicis TaxID=133412 RepID=A0A1R1XFH3_9FUNG|nr:putative glutamate-tRNA ligase, cytoplasmic [Smittium culicis]OMJ13371.1 putative glutamate-tRNA ligase, cytoplasmic [Smittium culicis]